MLRPIPRALLTDSLTLKVCTGVDAWQNPTQEEYAVSAVHLQDSNAVKKTANNTEVVLRGVLFVDSRRSLPSLDYRALCELSESNGKPLRAVVTSADGSVTDFEVVSVDFVPDVPSTRTHHVELGLV